MVDVAGGGGVAEVWRIRRRGVDSSLPPRLDEIDTPLNRDLS